MPNILIGKLPGRLLKPVQDETPIGALILHWSLSVLLILATGAQKNPDASYQILVSLYSYTIFPILVYVLALASCSYALPVAGNGPRSPELARVSILSSAPLPQRCSPLRTLSPSSQHGYHLLVNYMHRRGSIFPGMLRQLSVGPSLHSASYTGLCSAT